MTLPTIFALLKTVGEALFHHSMLGVRGPYWYATVCVYLAILGAAIYATAYTFGPDTPSSFMEAGIPDLDPATPQGELIEYLKAAKPS